MFFATRPLMLRCEDYFQAQKFFECLLLSGDPEE